MLTYVKHEVAGKYTIPGRLDVHVEVVRRKKPDVKRT